METKKSLLEVIRELALEGYKIQFESWPSSGNLLISMQFNKLHCDFSISNFNFIQNLLLPDDLVIREIQKIKSELERASGINQIDTVQPFRRVPLDFVEEKTRT